MRPIDADYLKAGFEEDGHLSPYIEGFINACPTVDPFIRGEWIEKKFWHEDLKRHLAFFVCSNCGQEYIWKPNFCPECGRKMLEVKQDDEQTVYTE